MIIDEAIFLELEIPKPKMEDAMVIIEEDNDVTFANRYMVIGTTYRGAHFYSESFDSYDDAIDVYPKYAAMVEYFGGGTVDMYEYSGENYKIICMDWI